MTQVIMTTKQTRIRCSDEKFLEAIFSSKTYAEIAEKTGQKVASTMARYARVKKSLSEKGVSIPDMQRKKTEKNIDNVKNMIEIVGRLKEASNRK